MFSNMRDLAVKNPEEFRLRSQLRAVRRGLTAARTHRPNTALVDGFEAEVKRLQVALDKLLSE